VRIFGLELIRSFSLINTARSVVSKICAQRGFLLKFWKRDISSASEKAFPRVFGDFSGCRTSSKRGILVHKTELAFCQWYCHSVESRADVSFQTKYSECLVTVELTPHTYISFRETLLYPSCLLLTVAATLSDSNYVNRSASLKRFSWIIFTIN